MSIEKGDQPAPQFMRSTGKTSEPYRFKIGILTIENENDTLPKLSLASISCVQQNKNEDVHRKETITPKDQIQQPIAKYIPPYLHKVDKIQVPTKRERKPTFPLATITKELQPKILKLKGIIKIEAF